MLVSIQNRVVEFVWESGGAFQYLLQYHATLNKIVSKYTFYMMVQACSILSLVGTIKLENVYVIRPSRSSIFKIDFFFLLQSFFLGFDMIKPDE